jgi:hypothetical protein
MADMPVILYGWPRSARGGMLGPVTTIPLPGADTQAREAASAVMGCFDRAAVDHHADEEQDLFPALREALVRVPAGDATALTAAAVETFVAAYTRHLMREEAELLPMAARLIDDTMLQQIGRAMRLRRGIDHVD